MPAPIGGAGRRRWARRRLRAGRGPGHAGRPGMAAERRPGGLSGGADRGLPASRGGRAHRVDLAAARLRRPGRHGRADRAQASIYARAKSALDQIQPLLAGLTPLNPALYQPQDLETIRSVVGTELQELVTELALEGGPRIQRVDELFQPAARAKGRVAQHEPGRGPGQPRHAAAALRADRRRDQTRSTRNASSPTSASSSSRCWRCTRAGASTASLLSAMSPRASFGTVLIWLSRGLEAVCESVGDLMFALDSVFVDAAQRQVIELRFAALASPTCHRCPSAGTRRRPC